MYTCAQHTFLGRLNNHFVKIQQAKWEPIQATVFQERALMETVKPEMIGALLFFIDLVITSHISLELANTAWPKRETCYRSVWVVSRSDFIQSLSSSLLTRDK